MTEEEVIAWIRIRSALDDLEATPVEDLRVPDDPGSHLDP